MTIESTPSGPTNGLPNPGPPNAPVPDPGPVEDIATFFRRLQWALLLAGVGLLVWVLTPVLTPFAASLLLAWLGDPVVDRLEKRGLSRNASVGLVFTVMLTNWALKVGWEAALTPVTYGVVGWLKRREGVDVFDANTDFTPFKLSA